MAEKHKTEKDQNAQLRNQVAQLLRVEQDQKLQLQQRDSTIETLQVSTKALKPTPNTYGSNGTHELTDSYGMLQEIYFSLKHIGNK